MRPLVLVSTSSFGRAGNEPVAQLEAFADLRLNPFGRTLTRDQCVELLRGVHGLIAGTEPLDRKVLSAASDLRVISRCGVGLSNIDLEAATEFGIRVTSTPGVHAGAVAELALGGILDLLRSISASDREVRRGSWTKPMGRMLRGRRVGLIGLGQVGTALALLLKPFEVEIVACDPLVTTSSAQAVGAKLVELEELLDHSEIVSLHLPLDPSTRGILGPAQLERLPAGALLINCARGGLVDEETLYEMLVSSRLGGAFLDTFDCEPYDGPLRSLENVVLSPHVGSYAVECRLQMELEAVTNLLRELQS